MSQLPRHSQMVGLDLHDLAQFVGPTDPALFPQNYSGAVVPGLNWLNTANPDYYVLSRRNPMNTGWVPIVGAAPPTLYAVASGGTGLNSLTAHGLLLGNGTAPVNFAGPGANGQLLMAQGASSDPTFVSITGPVAVGPGGVTAVGSGSITNTNLANSSVTVTAGTGLAGGGTVALGGTIIFSTIQDIAASASPTFTGLTLSGAVVSINGLSYNWPSSYGTGGALVLSGTALSFVPKTNFTQIVVNNQTGTAYTFAQSDYQTLVTFANAAAIAATLPQAGGSGLFQSGWWTEVQNTGAGTLTITPTTSTIDGVSSIALATNQGCVIVSDGTNYYTQRGMSSSGSVTSVDVSGGTTGLTFSGGPITSSGTLTMAGTLDVANGGTGTDLSAASAGVVFAPGSGLAFTVVSQLAVGNGGTGSDFSATGPGAVIQSSTGSSLSVVSQLGVAMGGTGSDLSTASAGLVQQTLSGGVLSTLVPGSAGDVVRSTGSGWASSAIQPTDLPTATTSTLGAVKVDGTTITISGGVISAAGSSGTVTSVDASGGTTGLTFSGGPVTTSGTLTMAGTLATANGGTGLAFLNAHAVLLGGGSGTVGFATVSTTGQVLIDQGPSADPAFTAISGSGATISLNSSGVLAISAIANSSLSNSSVTISGHSLSLGGTLNLAASDVGLGSVTNDTQTQAAIVPNTAPSAGQILVGNVGGAAYAPQSVSGFGATISLSSAGVVSISGIANASLTNSSITVTAGTGLSGGGSVALGSSVTLNNTGVLSLTGTSGGALTAALTLAGGTNTGMTFAGSGTTITGDIPTSATPTFAGLTLSSTATVATPLLTLSTTGIGGSPYILLTCQGGTQGYIGYGSGTNKFSVWNYANGDLTLGADSGDALWVKQTTRNIVIGNSGTDDGLGILQIGGNVTMTGTLLYAKGSYLGIVNGSTAAQILNVGSLACTDGFPVTPPTNGLYVKGRALFGTTTDDGTNNVQIAGGTALNVGANGQEIKFLTLTELTTIAAAATTDTALSLPANAVILGVSVYVQTVIPTATSFTVTGPTSATTFNTAAVSTALGSSDPGTKAGAFYNSVSQHVRFTMSGGTPATATGKVRVTIHYYVVTPASS